VMEAENVAAALGHRVTRSQARYGSTRQAKGGAAIVAARATHPVKETRPSVAAQKSGPDRGPGL
jgi:predicted Zn-dependent protease